MELGDARLNPTCPQCGNVRVRTGTTQVGGKPAPVYDAPCGSPCSATPPKSASARGGLGCLVVAAVLIAGVVALVMSLTGHKSARTPPGPDTSRLNGMTSCSTLQGEFDQASRNHDTQKAANNVTGMQSATTWMTAAEARMRALGCP